MPGSGGVCFDCVRATKNSELEIIRFSNVVENRLKTKLTKQRDQVGKIKWRATKLCLLICQVHKIWYVSKNFCYKTTVCKNLKLN